MRGVGEGAVRQTRADLCYKCYSNVVFALGCVGTFGLYAAVQKTHLISAAASGLAEQFATDSTEVFWIRKLYSSVLGLDRAHQFMTYIQQYIVKNMSMLSMYVQMMCSKHVPCVRHLN